MSADDGAAPHYPEAARGTSQFSLRGRTALITGAGGGIGQVLALEMAAAGADLLLVEHPDHPGRPELLAAIHDLGRRAEWLTADLGRTAGLRAAVDSAWAIDDGFDVLVNNAGVSSLGWFTEVTPERWRSTLAVNLDAAFVLSQRSAELMIASGRPGRIIMISSKNGQVAEQGLIAYNTSKAGLEMLARSLAVELGPYGITANSVCPGMIMTPMAEDFDLDWPAFQAYYEDHIPLAGGFGTPGDVAGAVIFLASDAGRYVTGHSLVVDGGVLAQQVPRAQFMRPLPVSSIQAASRPGENHSE
jgi:NAD(P)-dependent dehydrogenase (short-subunit alcohol dehydrogenase family)